MTATVLSSTEIQVNWTEVPEIDQNGIITQYEVMFELLRRGRVMGSRELDCTSLHLERCIACRVWESPDADGEVATNNSVFVGNNNYTVILFGLEEFMTYNISVRAYTSVGPGPYSMPEQTLMTLQDSKSTTMLQLHAKFMSM